MKNIHSVLLMFFFFFLIHESFGQLNDSIFFTQKLLGTDDLIHHIDSFGLKVVAASRSIKNVDDLPVTIYVITHEDILRNHYVTLVDVLKSLPGVRASQPGNGELGEVFLLRNLTGNYYTKILLDGMPVKPTVVSGMPIGGQLPVRQAERIEVVFGPSASIYGADAASGVINIITRQAEKGTFARADISLGQNEYSCMNYMIGGKAGRNKNLLQYNFYGSKTDFNNINIKNTSTGYYNPLEYYEIKGKKFNINGILYSAGEINEELLMKNGIQPSEFIEMYFPVNYKGSLNKPDMNAELSSGDYMIGINLNFRGVKLSYNNMYRRMHSSIGNSPFFFRYNDPSVFWGERIQRIILGYSTPVLKKLTNTTNISGLSYRMDNNTSQAITFIPGVTKSYFYSASDDILLEEIFTYTPILNLEILGGFSYQISSNLPKTNYLSEPFSGKIYKPFKKSNLPLDDLMNDFGYKVISFQNWSGFGQLYWVYRNFRLIGGLRYDINSLYGNNINPRIAFMYRFPKTSLRVSAGTAMKAPPSSVAYESLAYPTGSVPDSIHYLVIPNQKLKPENFTAYEFSVNRKLFRHIDFEISVYYNTIRNLINFRSVIACPDTLPLAVTDSVYTKTNDKTARSILFGGQISLYWNNIISKIKLNASLSLTYNADQSKNFSLLNEITNVFQLTPKHYGQFRLAATPFKNVYIQVDNTWMTEWMRLFTQKDLFKDISGYYTIDLLINYNIGMNLQAFIKYNNLLNEKYATPGIIHSDMEMISTPQPGRNFRVGLSYMLN
jgi:hemoglobin/transferrin/lactoferrin receptor protein